MHNSPITDLRRELRRRHNRRFTDIAPIQDIILRLLSIGAGFALVMAWLWLLGKMLRMAF